MEEGFYSECQPNMEKDFLVAQGHPNFGVLCFETVIWHPLDEIDDVSQVGLPFGSPHMKI